VKTSEDSGSFVIEVFCWTSTFMVSTMKIVGIFKIGGGAAAAALYRKTAQQLNCDRSILLEVLCWRGGGGGTG
jgi:hypothetical protein